MKYYFARGVVIMLIAMTAMFPAIGSPKMEWIRIRSIGAQDKPLPTVWISMQPINGAETDLNEYVRLGAPSFEAVVKFSRNYSCSEHLQAAELEEFGTIEVSGSGARQVSVICVMNRGKACGYLHGLLRVPELKEDLQRLSPITNLARRLGCDMSQTGQGVRGQSRNPLAVML